MKKYRSLKFKLFLPLVLGIIFTFIILSYVIIENETQVEKDSRITNGLSYAELSVASIIKNYDLLYNTGFYKFSELTCDLLELNENVKNVQIVSSSGTILFDTSELETGKYDSSINNERIINDPVILEQIHSYNPLINEKESSVEIIQPYIDEWGRHDYSVIYTISLENLNTVMENSYMQILPITVFLIILFLITLLLFRYYIDQPLKKLIDGIIQMKQGHLGVTVDIHGNDEIGNLSKVFNKMSIDLKDTTEYLERYNENLEQTVSDRTLELQKNNEELIETKEELEKLNKNLEAEVEKRTEKIQHLLNQKDMFVNQLGHDLKNPLGPLLNLLPVLDKHITKDDDKQIVNVLMRNVNYMRNLVQKTLELARLNSPNTHLHFEEMNLEEHVKHIIENNQFLFKDNSISIETNIPQDTIIIADKLRVEELFNNLFNNAVKYSPPGGTVKVAVKNNKDEVTISIKDQGIGMTEEQINLIFDEFYKADAARHDFDSSGLGMPICKRIVEKHGGNIWVESTGLGRGCTFYFTLPKAS